MKFYRCLHCHSLVAKLNEPGSTPSCCGEMMQELIPNEGDGAFEKHVPEVKIEDNRVLVQVGSTLHPMTEAHYIEWIYLKTDKALHAKESCIRMRNRKRRSCSKKTRNPWKSMLIATSTGCISRRSLKAAIPEKSGIFLLLRAKKVRYSRTN